jgi:L-amino acid N-acyltransferase YncA
MPVLLEYMQTAHWQEIKRIYTEGIDTGNATFETECPEWETWDKNHIKSCRLVALDGNKIVGWAALSPVSERCVYQGVAEVSIYIDSHSRGKGIGEELMNRLINESESAGLWTLQAGIFPENTGSCKLHEKTGFRLVGKREKVGRMHGKWRDVLLYERRSKMANFL